MASREELRLREQRFQDALSGWLSNNNAESWNTMWICVLDCCTNICKSKAKNKYIPELDQKALDATIYIMDFIRRGARPEKLSSYCYLRCVKYLLDPKTQFWERNIVLADDLEHNEGDYDDAEERC